MNASAHQLDVLIAGGSLLALLLLIVANSIIVQHAAERTRAEVAWRANAERYQSLFESALDGIVLVTSDETITDVNPAFERRRDGHGKDYWVSGSALSFYRLQSYLRQDTRLHIYWNPSQPHTRLRRKDGDALAVEGWVTSLHDHYGNLIGVQGIYRDLSQQIPVTSSASVWRQPPLVAEAMIGGH